MVVHTTRSALAFEFAQAAVVDPQKLLAYLMAPGSSIDEIDLSSGQILAESTRGARPLLLYNSILLAPGITDLMREMVLREKGLP
jgi:hypothetical protein